MNCRVACGRGRSSILLSFLLEGGKEGSKGGRVEGRKKKLEGGRKGGKDYSNVECELVRGR